MRMYIHNLVGPWAGIFARPKVIRLLATGKPVNECVARDLHDLPESILRDIGYTSF